MPASDIQSYLDVVGICGGRGPISKEIPLFTPSKSFESGHFCPQNTHSKFYIEHRQCGYWMIFLPQPPKTKIDDRVGTKISVCPLCRTNLDALHSALDSS